ncbi:hypothetical protein [Streptomyces sp. NPDC001292]|uniref:hypothetical protein n=1 Tax=Streptomyces sp. NPDC001292 TaxID=3364558 RepID=UPI0036A18AAD
MAGDFDAQPRHARLDRITRRPATPGRTTATGFAQCELDGADLGHCTGHGERAFTVPADCPGPGRTDVRLDYLFVRATQISGA